MGRHFGHLELGGSSLLNVHHVKCVLRSIVKDKVAVSYCCLLTLAIFPWTVASLTCCRHKKPLISSDIMYY